MKIVNKLNNKAKAGFSLVELLVVIAVIGILAAIAIPALSNVFESSKQAKDKRNAQSLVSTYNAARAAGVSTTTLGVNGTTGTPTLARTAVATALNGGVQGTGPFSTTVFKMTEVAGQDAADMDQYLVWDDQTKILTYSGATSAGASN